MIDIQTLVFANTALGFLCSVLLTVNWRLNKQVKGTMEWCFSLWLWSFSMLSVMFRTDLNADTINLISNSLIVIGSFFLLSGISHYNSAKRLSFALIITLSLVIILWLAFSIFSLSDDKYRLLILMIFSAAVKFTAIYLLLPTIYKYSVVGILMGLGFFAHALFFSYSAYSLLHLSNVPDAEQFIFIAKLLFSEVLLFMIWFTVSASMLTNLSLQEDLAKMAYFDPLTGLLNRNSIYTEIIKNQQSNGDSLTTVLIIDLDHFKKVNDSYGHDIGDNLIQHFVKIARKELRENDIFGRLGGEEFIVAINNSNKYAADDISCRILNKVNKKPYHKAGLTINFTVSIGYSIGSALNQDELIQLINKADKAMYLAKSSGRAQYASVN